MPSPINIKLIIPIILLACTSCQNPTQNKPQTQQKDTTHKSAGTEKINTNQTCENENYTAVLEEIPNRETDAYKITIRSKKENTTFSKTLDIRPEMSQIHSCNDLYVEVGFPCGGPCYSRVFIFTDKNREMEQYNYVQEVKNNPNLIAYINNEEFEKLIIHNFSNGKELMVDISDGNDGLYGSMDSILVKKENVFIYYPSQNGKQKTKKVSLKELL